MTDLKPAVRPARPNFSSGPCVKRPGWSAANLQSAPLGRSHRSAVGKALLKRAIDKTREILEVPSDYRIAIVPASDTGAVEAAMWSMLGPRPVTVAAWESFGLVWVTDAVKQLKLEPQVLTADYGQLPDLSKAPSDHDIIFTWNGTTAGVRVPNADWIADDREGLTICDATSAAFAQELDWSKLDVLTYSWQKVMGGEAAHGILILSPRAVERLETHTPAWPVPKLFRLTKNGKLNEGIFEGVTINTPSLLCVEDYLDTLQWAEDLGGLKGLIKRADANCAALSHWIEKTPWTDFLCENPAYRTNTSVCIKIVDDKFDAMSEPEQRAFVKEMETLLEREGAAFDVNGYRDAPPSLRIWCGSTVDTDDIKNCAHGLNGRSPPFPPRSFV